ncbi:tRNA 5-methylaminomethyl-2-thiouridine biosynthesis bifunctional protein MnmC [Bacteroidales bacterium Barb6XT]|nr:tRNA 5-methylaminomethyl-2-thiouridine biosynthesis bifunctional protein MnmC [Bacteroidales bacterium Barb6XT]
MEKELQTTADGSHTLFVPSLGEHYHSVNGALQESQHIFIQAGLRQAGKQHIRLFEIGFGTGLNSFLTLKEAETSALHIHYYTIELYPLEKSLIATLNYGEMVWQERKDLFEALHEAAWNCPVDITPSFTLHKTEGDCNRLEFPSNIDLIYFDAFSPDKQPEMWSRELFDRLYAAASPAAVIVTYCAKGEVRRRMQAAGFTVQRLPGPPGKRHILFGRKQH